MKDYVYTITNDMTVLYEEFLYTSYSLAPNGLETQYVARVK